MAGATIGGLTALGGIYQAIQGAIQAKESKLGLLEEPLPDTQNVYAGQQVSKEGNKLISEQSQNRFASNVEALRSGGIRGVIGGLSDVNAQAKQTDLQIKGDYDKQENEIAMAQAGDEANIRAIKEARHQADVAALSSQYSAGQQMLFQGIHGAMQGVVSGGQMYQQKKEYDAMKSGWKFDPQTGKPIV